jgi:hypothetical protein
MVNSFSTPDREVENSKQTTGGDLSDNNRDNNIITQMILTGPTTLNRTTKRRRNLVERKR